MIQARNMLIGIMADTHDNLPLVEKAVQSLNEENVGLVLHAGDYVAGFVIPKFKGLHSKLIGVFGNNDGDRELLTKRFSENPNLEMRGNFAEVVFEGLKIALLHGSDRELLKALIESQSFDVVVHGHSHLAEVYRSKGYMIQEKGYSVMMCKSLAGGVSFTQTYGDRFFLTRLDSF
jgi:putative phosphoesterase